MAVALRAQEALCILECHLDRSGRFLGRASSLHPSLPGGPRRGSIPQLQYRPQGPYPTSDWASKPDGLQGQGPRKGRAQAGATQHPQGRVRTSLLPQPWVVGLAGVSARPEGCC